LTTILEVPPLHLFDWAKNIAFFPITSLRRKFKGFFYVVPFLPSVSFQGSSADLNPCEYCPPPLLSFPLCTSLVPPSFVEWPGPPPAVVTPVHSVRFPPPLAELPIFTPWSRFQPFPVGPGVLPPPFTPPSPFLSSISPSVFFLREGPPFFLFDMAQAGCRFRFYGESSKVLGASSTIPLAEVRSPTNSVHPCSFMGSLTSAPPAIHASASFASRMISFGKPTRRLWFQGAFAMSGVPNWRA